MEITRPQVLAPQDINKECGSTTGYETKPDTKDPNYRYKVLAQTLAANVHNDKLSDAAFRQFVTNCVQEFIPSRDASLASTHAQQFGAKDEAQLQLRTDIWQFKGSTVYKLQDTGFIGSSQFQNEYLFNVQYVPLRGDGSSQAERDSRKEKMAQYVAACLNTRQWFEAEPQPDTTRQPSLKYRAFTAALNELCKHHRVVLQVQPAAAHLDVRDSTEFDENVGTPPTYLANLRDATDDDWRTLGCSGPPADLLDSGNHEEGYQLRPHNGLGYCPVCGCPGVRREMRPGGEDTCESNHRYPSTTAQYPDKEKS